MDYNIEQAMKHLERMDNMEQDIDTEHCIACGGSYPTGTLERFFEKRVGFTYLCPECLKINTEEEENLLT